MRARGHPRATAVSGPQPGRLVVAHRLCGQLHQRIFAVLEALAPPGAAASAVRRAHKAIQQRTE
jgi:hypothetical protein